MCGHADNVFYARSCVNSWKVLEPGHVSSLQPGGPLVILCEDQGASCSKAPWPGAQLTE